jgi:hypothetical protein
MPDYDGIHALENPGDMLNRIAAGYRAAAVHKLLFDEAETAVILDCTIAMLRAWRKTGTGPPWVLLDGRWVKYPRSGLRRFVAQLEQHTVHVPKKTRAA